MRAKVIKTPKIDIISSIFLYKKGVLKKTNVIFVLLTLTSM
jgi:hypothetical protein